MLFVVFVGTALAAGVFAGGRNDGNSTAGSQGSIAFNKTGYPITNEKVSFTAAGVFRASRNPDEMPMLKYLAEKTNVSFQWTMYTPDSLNERKNLMWASGDYPELITNSALSVGDVLKYGAQENILIELQDMIPQYMPNFMKVKNTIYPEIQSVVTLQNGKVYSLPRVNPQVNETGGGFYINKTWLAKLGLNVPVTTDDFLQVLRAFRDNDVNGNGNRNDEVPFTWDNSTPMYGISNFMGIFGKAGGSSYTELLVENGKVYFPMSEPSFRDCIAYLAQLYKENLIDPEVFTQDQAAFYAKGKGRDQIYGSLVTWRTGLVVGDNEKKEDYLILPPLKFKNVNAEWLKARGWSIDRSAAGITVKARTPEIILRYMDYLYDSYWGAQAWIGMVGDNVEIKNGGFSYLPDPPEYSNHSEWQNANIVWLPSFCSREDMLPIFQTGVGDLQQLEKNAKYGPYFRDHLFPLFWMTPEESEKTGPITSDITTYVRRMIASWISGEQDVNATWSEYLRQLDNMGLKTYIELHQRVYDGMK